MEKHNKDEQESAVQNVAVLDDTTLLTVVTFLYAFFQFFSLFNLPTCTC